MDTLLNDTPFPIAHFPLGVIALHGGEISPHIPAIVGFFIF